MWPWLFLCGPINLDFLNAGRRVFCANVCHTLWRIATGCHML